jgi:hypothetical protein
MSFTANCRFRSAPRVQANAKGMYYTWMYDASHDGRRILDGPE